MGHSSTLRSGLNGQEIAVHLNLTGGLSLKGAALLFPSKGDKGHSREGLFLAQVPAYNPPRSWTCICSTLQTVWWGQDPTPWIFSTWQDYWPPTHRDLPTCLPVSAFQTPGKNITSHSNWGFLSTVWYQHTSTHASQSSFKSNLHIFKLLKGSMLRNQMASLLWQ